MSGCERFRDIIERHLAGESSPEEARALREHAEGCLECRQMTAAHDDLSRAATHMPEPSESRFRAMRDSVLSQIREEARRKALRAWPPAGFRGSLLSLRAARPALAVLSAVVLAAGGFALGRLSAPAATFDESLLLSEINRQASMDKGLATYWDSPFAYSNVDARKLESGKIALGFDVTRHVDVDTRTDSPLVKEVLLHAILDSPTMGSRFKAMELARESMDPKIREVLVFTLLNDPSLPVRLGALDILKQHATDPDVREALLTSLRQDPSVQIRFLALECLAGQHVDQATILRAIGEVGDDAGRAVLERAEQLTSKL